MKQIKIKNGTYYFLNDVLMTFYTELWDKIKYMIKAINGGKVRQYEKDYMRIKFNLNDNLSLNEIPKLHNLTLIVRSVFEEDSKYYAQVF